MKDKLLKLGRHFFVYGVGNALSAAVGFLLIPLYTNVLSTKEYGILELLNRTSDIFILVAFMGIRQAFIRFYFDHDDIKWHKTVISTTTIFVLTTSFIIALVIFPLKALIADMLFNDPALGVLFLYILIWLPLKLQVNIGMSCLQIQMRSVVYVLISILSFIFIITSNLVLVYYYKQGIVGILITNVWVSAIFGLTFLFLFIKWAGLHFSFNLIKDLLKFGLPYLPTTFFMFIIINSDRYFLSVYSSLEAVGIYALGYKIGMFGIALIMDPFGKIWTPFLFENHNKTDGPALISKVFTLYTSISVSVGLVISVLSPIIIPLISGKAFHESYKIVPMICLASIFWGMASLSDAGILISKKTTYKPLIFGSASIVAIVCNFVLIQKFGAYGAAIASVLTFFALFSFNYAVSIRFYPLMIECKKILLIFLSALTVYLFSTYLLSFGDDLQYRKIYSVLSLFVFPIILWFGGFFSEDEKQIVRRIIVKRSL